MPNSLFSNSNRSSIDSNEEKPIKDELMSSPEISAETDGFSPEEISEFMNILNSSPKHPPPKYYLCHVCFRPDHFISECPLRPHGDQAKTPYQGNKKCFGEYFCQPCRHKWTSQNSCANIPQTCSICKKQIYARKQIPIDKAAALGLVDQKLAIAELERAVPVYLLSHPHPNIIPVAPTVQQRGNNKHSGRGFKRGRHLGGKDTSKGGKFF